MCSCRAEGGQGMLQDQVDREEGNLGRDQQLAPLQALLLAKGGEDGLETGILSSLEEMPGSSTRTLPCLGHCYFCLPPPHRAPADSTLARAN